MLVVVLCLAAGVYSWVYFPSAFPILDLSIEMDRGTAMTTARKLARQRDLAPDGFSRAARFHHDEEVQTFVELEAGGKDAFREMMRTGRYHPFQWHVRFYRPGETRETLIRFRPDGRVYGFRETWPESAGGPALSAEGAREIAESRAAKVWAVDLSKYRFLSSGRTTRPSGRVDHTFTYERREVDIGDGEYRLRLGVSGDQLSEVTRYVHVPEAFTRRYQNMRSANNLIQSTGNIFVFVLHLLVGGLFGCYWLVTVNALRWRTALAWGGGLTVLMFLARLNSLPLSWMEYDTAMTVGGFLSQQIVNALSSSLLFGVIITLSFVAAEGLTRRAFGHHPKLWRAWNPAAAGSRTIGSLTLLGYLLLGPYFAYNVALYAFAQETLGWWTPSSILYNPNVLAHYATWLEPVVNSLRAGFWEECLFRAVPLAGAALLGTRCGKRRWWIGGALILQALVFGAGHASYATQPSYARVVELFFSSIGLGLIYLGYGLLPTVFAHYLYDLVLMSLPIFAATAPGILTSQVLVVLMGSVPLLVVIGGYFYSGGWVELPEGFWNRHADAADTDGNETWSLPVRPGLSFGRTLAVVLAGVLGLGVWMGYGDFETREVPLRTTVETALQEARSTLEEAGDTPADWMQGATVDGSASAADRFVWQTGGDSAYRRLMGTFLAPPHWRVRFFTFEGSLTRRAEEYRVRLAPAADLRALEHKLPKSAEGDSLAEAPARRLADSAVITRFGYEIEDLTRVRAEPQPRPNRRDWTFEYEVPGAYPLEDGEARVRVNLAGSEVTEVGRYVHVPESWRRADRSRRKMVELMGTSAGTLLYLLALAGAFAGLVVWGRGEGFDRRVFLLVLVGYVLLAAAGTANRWPRILAGFSTAEPFWNQVGTALMGRVTTLFAAGVLGLGAGFAHGGSGRNRSGSIARSILTGLGAAGLAAGLVTLAGWLAPDLAPRWGSYASLDTARPLVHHTLFAARQLVTGTVLLLVMAAGVHRLSRAGRRHSGWTLLGLALVGAAAAGSGQYLSLTGGGLRSLLFAGFFAALGLFVLPFDRAFIPTAVGAYLVLSLLEVFFTSVHPYAFAGPGLAIVFVLLLAGAWTTILHRRQTRKTP